MNQWVIRMKTLHYAPWKKGLAAKFNKENPNVKTLAEMTARKLCPTL